MKPHVIPRYEPTHRIIVCMGSSCYLRGNARNTEIIRDFLETKGLDAAVEFSGALCSEHCTKGPVLTIDGELLCQVKSEALPALLDQRLAARKDREA